MEFTLTKQAAKVAHINLREEMHGEEPLLAVDVKVQCDVPNDFLSYLAPTLKWSLYDKPDKQGELIEDTAHLPRLRYPSMAVLRWDGKMEKASLTIHGAKKAQDLQVEADVDKLQLECKDGGTVSVTFRAQVIPTPEQSAALVGFLGKEVKVSVSAAGSEE